MCSMPRLFLRAVPAAALLGAAFAMTVACGAADDGAVTGDDQNLEEDPPCKPLDSLACKPGYDTIMLLNCPKDQGRCSVSGCRPADTTRCVDGYEPTSSHCKSKGAARCVAVDGGAGRVSDAGSADATRRD
jgi:hypothetical protein